MDGVAIQNSNMDDMDNKSLFIIYIMVHSTERYLFVEVMNYKCFLCAFTKVFSDEGLLRHMYFVCGGGSGEMATLIDTIVWGARVVL